MATVDVALIPLSKDFSSDFGFLVQTITKELLTQDSSTVDKAIIYKFQQHGFKPNCRSLWLKIAGRKKKNADFLSLRLMLRSYPY